MVNVNGPTDTGVAPGPPVTPPGSGPEKRAAYGVRSSRAAVAVVERYGLLLMLVVMTVVFAGLPESGEAFRSSANVQALLANQAVGLAVALALLFPMAAGYLDFSVGAVSATACVVAAAGMSRFGLPMPVAVAIALAAGVLIGVVLGLLVARFSMNPFIATLGMATLLGGAIFAYTDGMQITEGIAGGLTDLGSLTWFGVPRIVVAAAGMGVVVWFVIGQTPLGRHLFAVGSNANAARLVGVDVMRVQFLSFVLSGLVAAAAGVLLLARQGAATSDSGMSLLFPALTAVFLSTIVIELGRPSVLGTVIGVLFVAVSVSGLTLVGAPSWVSQVFNGAALLVAVGMASIGRPRGGVARG
ncbi:ABC transporter permease [Actinomadura mexicana]|uniref:Autoinducer 2 import system permease protein LsrD n=1 Tax=Actinomadura mexicana TaxID=134959 RepID=A0A238X9X7_9ACTN|nr:ABC transporter permease [Actinomadura mexicana]SNR55371.1 monosaccharide ABC transporter membrane protein, CUT2 family [Actinomadura mexicana]